MKIHNTGDEGIAVLLDSNDLVGIVWDEFDSAAAHAVVENALKVLGDVSAVPISVDAFVNNDSILILAKLTPLTNIFVFEHIDDLLTAMAIIPQQANEIYSLDQLYYVIINGEPSPLWGEYGQLVDIRFERLSEYGALLLSQDKH